MTAIFKSAQAARDVIGVYRETLTYWPVPHSHLALPTRQGETFVVACGPEHAPPLLLLHGSQANSASWIPYVSMLAQRFRVYAIDLIGEAGLSAPSRPPLDSDAYALWLDDVMLALQVPRAALAGISLGAWMALDFAIRRPARVERLALFCPPGIGAQKRFLLRVAPLSLLGAWGRRRIRDIVLGPMPADLPPAGRAVVRQMETIDRSFRPRLGKIPVFTDSELRTITMPLLVIVGGRDALIDSAQTRQRMHRVLPNAKVHFLDDQPHFVRGQGSTMMDFLTDDMEGLQRDA